MRIAMFLNNLDGEYQLSVYRGVREEARELGIGLLCVQCGGPDGSDKSGAFPAPRLIAADGILLLSTVFDDIDGIPIPRGAPLPMVSIGVLLPGCPSIVVKNRESMELLMEHLIMVHGYRDFIYIGGPAGHQDNLTREDVFRKAINGGRGSFPGLRGRVYSGIFNDLSGTEIIRNHIALHPEAPDCIVAASDNIAVGVQELLQSLPDSRWRNCPVTGFDDISLARLVKPPLTTVRQPLAEQGRMALRTIRDLVLGKPAAPVAYVESTLALRSSCGCPEGPELLTAAPPRRGASPYDIVKSELYSISVNNLGHNLALVGSLPAMIPGLEAFLTRLHVARFYFVLYGEPLKDREPLKTPAGRGLLMFERSGGGDRSYAETPPALVIGSFFRGLKTAGEFQDLCLFHLRSGEEYLGFVVYQAPDQVYPHISSGVVFIANAVRRLRSMEDEKERARKLEQEVAYRTRDLLELNRELQKEAERRIAVEAEVLRISDLERRRFSADLHDDICQRLAGISMFCKSLIGQGAPAVFLPELSELIDETLVRTRRYAHDSFPMDLDAFGLREAIAGLCDSIGREGGIPCTFSWGAPEKLPLNRNQELNIYRIIQEALQNVLKHSGAALAQVELNGEAESLRLRIKDNGRGMTRKGRKGWGQRSLGLRSMEYRAHQLGAEYRLSSRRGSTVVELVIPLGNPPANPPGPGGQLRENP
ncbi:MAG: substrate-binding domain-containing protein [Spirochaetaceae bacterium]|jgi:signal transduction histidine kinase/DNA-binding LacI/PurR family transcriptional regulator|nr:substrate-binding domain-containing protein [Spirochaetaceae bacterium]